MASKSTVTYALRAKDHPNPVVRRLFEVAAAKGSNVVFPADVTTTKELLNLADSESQSHLWISMVDESPCDHDRVAN